MKLIKSISCIVFLFLTHTLWAQSEQQDSILKSIELKEVNISALKAKKAPDSHFYESSTLANTEDILSRIEGVNLIRRGPIGMEPTLRGFSGGQINLVIDGMKMFGACTDKMDPVSIYIEPINLQSLDVGNGGDGMAMGSSIGGSMNLKLASAKTNADQKLALHLSSGYYSAAKATQNALALNYSKEKWGLRVSGTYRKAQNYTDGNKQVVDFSQYEKFNLSTSASYEFTPSSYLSLDLLIDDAWDIGYPALPMDVGKAEARIGSVSYKNYDISSLIDYVEAKVYANSVVHDMDDSKRPDIVMHMDMPGWSYTQGAYAQAKSRKLGIHTLNAKADFYHNSLEADMTMYLPNVEPMYMLTWPKTDLYSAGLFIEDRIDMSSRSELNLKARLEYTNAKVNSEMGQDQFAVFDYDISTGKNDVLKNLHAGYRFSVNERINLFASLGYAERLPSASERFGFYLFNRMDNHDYIGNPLLENEKAINSEVNFLYSFPNFTWKVSGFHNYITNYIQGQTRKDLSAMTIGAEGVRSYTNLDYATMLGLENNINYRFWNNRMTINQSLKWLKGVNMNNQPLPFMSPLKAITSFRYNHAHYFVQIENELSAKQHLIDASFGEQETSGFSLIHIRTNYHFKYQQRDVNVGLGVENLFNKAYNEHLDWGGILRPGRNIYVNLSFAI